MYKICSKCSPWDMISILWRCLLHSAFLRLESKWKYLILHTLAGIVWIMEAHSDWKPPFKWNAGNSMHHRFDVFLQKSLRCAFDGVIVTIHCNAQWNDNIFFPQPVKQSQSFDNHMKDLSADNPNIWWSTQAAFFLSVAHDIFFSPFLCTELCVPDPRWKPSLQPQIAFYYCRQCLKTELCVSFPCMACLNSYQTAFNRL